MKFCKRATQVFAAAALLLLQSTPSWTQCRGPYLNEVRRVLDLEGEKTEQFRTGNKPAFNKIYDARTKAGQRSKAADKKLAAELKNRMLEVHDGMPKQIAAIQTLLKDMAAATERNDCVAAEKSAEIWVAQAKERIAEYDRYFGYLDGLTRPASQKQSR